MTTDNLIPIAHFCTSHNIEITFIESLQEYGLVETVVVQQTRYLAPEHLAGIERIIRLHYDMNINLEGIDAILHLLERVEALQGELNAAKNRLRVFE